MTISPAALVTGSSGGIGLAIAKHLAGAGWAVCLHYHHNRAAAESALKSLPGSGHGVVSGDLRTRESVRELALDARAAVGPLTLLVNNAALATSRETVHDPLTTEYETWDRRWHEFLDANVVGTANLCWQAAQAMVEDGVRGRIINIGSRGGFSGEPLFPAYGASKAAIHSLTQSLAIALAPHGIAVAAVAPGFIHTDRVADRVADEPGLALQSPFNRVGTPTEVASAVVYLASPDAEWAAGTVLHLNGASYLH